jgi:hypothetical protein
VKSDGRLECLVNIVIATKYDFKITAFMVHYKEPNYASGGLYCLSHLILTTTLRDSKFQIRNFRGREIK